MGNRGRKLLVSYIFSDVPKHGYGLYVSEGSVERKGSLRKKIIGDGGGDCALAVMCHVAAESGERTGEAVGQLLKAFEYWFGHEFPESQYCFSPEVIKRYWYNMLCGVAKGAECGWDLAVMLVHAGRYVVLGMGEIVMYEYSFDKNRYRRIYAGQERKEFDLELGIPEEETADFSFLCRSISKKSLYLIVPRHICLEYPGKIMNNRHLQRWMSHLAGKVPCAAALVYGGGAVQ